MGDAETSLEDLLRTNYVPTDIQRSSVRGLVDKNKSKLSDLGADIDRLRLGLAQLRRSRRAILADIERYEVLLSSARRVMNIPELIGEIFLHYIYIFGVFDSGEWRHLHYSWRDTPLALSHVCRIWRRVALTTPELWSAFEVTGYRRSAVPINICLSRSKSSPLSFGIELGYLGRSSHDIAALSIHQNRWRHVYINSIGHGHGSGSIQNFLSSVSDTCPMLEKLHLSATHNFIETNFFAPNLTQLELKGCLLTNDQLSFPSLREIIIRDTWYNASLDYCLSMCRRHLTLEKAVFHISSARMMTRYEDIVVLPSLKDLHLSVTSNCIREPADASHLLMTIRAPALKRLHIQSIDEPIATMSTLEAVLPFLKGSNAPIASLHLHGNYSNMDSVVEFLEHLPHLQELGLSSRHLNPDDLLTHLQKPMVKHTSTILCAPELAVIGPLRPTPTLALMVDFILSRSSNGISGLREVVVDSESRETVDDLRSHPGISERIKDGLKVIKRSIQ